MKTSRPPFSRRPGPSSASEVPQPLPDTCGFRRRKIPGRPYPVGDPAQCQHNQQKFSVDFQVRRVSRQLGRISRGVINAAPQRSTGRNLSMTGSNQYVMPINLRRMERSAFMEHIRHGSKKRRSGSRQAAAAQRLLGPQEGSPKWAHSLTRMCREYCLPLGRFAASTRLQSGGAG
jgi:hypothetical protein